jgi:hypothetical protein
MLRFDMIPCLFVLFTLVKHHNRHDDCAQNRPHTVNKNISLNIYHISYTIRACRAPYITEMTEALPRRPHGPLRGFFA